MGIVTLPHTTKSDTDSNLFSDVKENDQAIIDVVNGNIDTANIATSGVGSSEIAAGAVTDAKMGLTLHQDSDNGSITSTGAMPNVSLTPGAGTYFAYASVVHEAVSASGQTEASISLRVNGVFQYSSGGNRLPAAATSGVTTIVPIVIAAIIAVGAGQAVDVLGTITTNAKLTGCRLSLIRIA